MKKYLKHIHLIKNESGQSTVEFAIVLTAILAIVILLGVFLKFVDGGTLVDHAADSASHNVSEGMLGILGDVFCF